MRLQPHLVRKSKVTGKPFYKHSIDVPAAALKKLGWTADNELEWRVQGDAFVVRSKK